MSGRLNRDVTLTFGTGNVSASTVDVSLSALIIYSCRYTADGVVLPETSTTPPPWTYYLGTATARKVSGNYPDCRDEVTGDVSVELT